MRLPCKLLQILRSKALNGHSKALNAHSKALNAHSKALNGELSIDKNFFISRQKHFKSIGNIFLSSLRRNLSFLQTLSHQLAHEIPGRHLLECTAYWLDIPKQKHEQHSYANETSNAVQLAYADHQQVGGIVR